MSIKKISKKNILFSVIIMILVVLMMMSFTLAMFSANATATGVVEFSDNITVKANSTIAGAIGSTSSMNYSLNLGNEVTNSVITGDKKGNYNVLTYGTKSSVTSGLKYTINSDMDIYIGFEVDIKYIPNDSGGVSFNSIDSFNIFLSFEGLDYEEVMYGQSGTKSDYSFTYPSSKISEIASVGGELLNGCNLQITAPYLSSGRTKGYNPKKYFAKTYRMYFTTQDKDRNGVIDTDGYSDYAQIHFTFDKTLTIDFDKIIGELRFATQYNDIQTTTPNILNLMNGKLYVSYSCKVGMREFYDGFINADSEKQY